MSDVQKWLEDTTDDEMMMKLGHIHPRDYQFIVDFLKGGNIQRAIAYLRFDAVDKVSDLAGALYFVKLIQRFEDLNTSAI